MGRQPELIGGGLIRSLGGWSQVQSAQRKSQKTEYDERILGSGDFVTAIFKEAEEKQIRQLKLSRSGRTISDIIREECKRNKVSAEEVKRGNRRRKASEARMAIARRSRNELGLSGAEIARHLGVNTSGINRALAEEDDVAGKS
jgi:chromosomal replication initiation ATPase DnaA